MTNLARATAQHAEDTIRQVDVVTAALSERVEGDGLQNMDVARIHKLLVQQAAIMPQLHGLFIYGPDGQWLVTDKEVIPETANNADRDYFQYHRTHEDRGVRIGEVIKSRSTNDLIIPVSRRLNNPDGSFAGVLLGTVKVSYFVDYYGDFKIDDKGALVLATRSGTILVRRPFVESVIGKSLVNSVIFKNYLPTSNQGTAEARAVVDDTERLYGFRALTTYPLVVEAGLSRESIIAPWRRDLFKTSFVLIFPDHDPRRLRAHRAEPAAPPDDHGKADPQRPPDHARHGADRQPDRAGQPQAAGHRVGRRDSPGQAPGFFPGVDHARRRLLQAFQRQIRPCCRRRLPARDCHRGQADHQKAGRPGGPVWR
nr:hypothetical protein GCM10020185_78920 [Pseudomonas brassicacearum subsp. brassicacearum]